MDPNEDKYVPEEYVGKLESNFYCRRWIPKRNKYCEQPAGHDTEHTGIGRCSKHDGRNIVHGERSKYADFIRKKNLSPVERYRELPETLQDLYEGQNDDPDPLNVEADIRLARAVLLDYVQRYHDMRMKLDTWYEWYMDEFDGAPPKVDLLPVEHVVTFLKKVTDIAHKERKLRMQDAVSTSELYRIMAKMGKVVEHWITHEDMPNEEKLKRIKEDWLKIDVER